MRTIGTIVAGALAIALLAPHGAAAAPTVAPDRDFGKRGLSPSFDFGNDTPHAAPLSEGRTLLVAEDRKERGTIYRRLDARGRLDRSYGENGELYEPTLIVRDTAVAPSGQVLVTGSLLMDDGFETVRVFAVLALRPDGTPDLAFGDQGLAAFVGNSDFNTGERVTVMPDGRIVAAGSFTQRKRMLHAIVRLMPDGSPDLTFNGGEPLVQPIPSGGWLDGVRALVVEPDGAIVVRAANVTRPIDDPRGTKGLDTDDDTYFRVSADGSAVGPIRTLGWPGGGLPDSAWMIAAPGGGFATGHAYGIARLNADLRRNRKFKRSSRPAPRRYPAGLAYSEAVAVKGRLLTFAGSSRAIRRRKRIETHRWAVTPVLTDARTGKSRHAGKPTPLGTVRYRTFKNDPELFPINFRTDFHLSQVAAAPGRRLLLALEVPHGKKRDDLGVAVLRMRVR